MSVRCRYGDEEDVELVDCSVDTQTGEVSCPDPPARRRPLSNNVSTQLRLHEVFTAKM